MQPKTNSSNSTIDPIRILIADDHEIFRRGLCSLLESETHWKVCGEAANGREAIEKFKALSPDLVILDITMPELNGLEAARTINKISPKTPIFILSQHDSLEMLAISRDAGARGYVCKSEISRKLLSALRDLFPQNVPSLAPVS